MIDLTMLRRLDLLVEDQPRPQERLQPRPGVTRAEANAILLVCLLALTISLIAFWVAMDARDIAITTGWSK